MDTEKKSRRSTDRMRQIKARRLCGDVVVLEQLSPEAMPEVRRALDVDVGEWALMGVNAAGANFEPWWAAEMLSIERDEPRHVLLIRRREDGLVCGVTGFCTIEVDGRRVSIGSSFLHPSARGSAVNAESKLLLLRHAFASGVVRVDAEVEPRNFRSQRAVETLGWVKEDVFRNRWVSSSGLMCDSISYVVVDEDWPRVEAVMLDVIARRGARARQGRDERRMAET